MASIAAGMAGTVPAAPRDGSGAQDLAAVPFHVANRAAAPIACVAAIAHWFSADIGRAEPGGAVEAELRFDPATGTVYLLNGVGDAMPVQSLLCGVAGRAVTTGSPIPLQRRKGSPEPPIAFTCTGPTAAGQLDCRPEDRNRSMRAD